MSVDHNNVSCIKDNLLKYIFTLNLNKYTLNKNNFSNFNEINKL